MIPFEKIKQLGYSKLDFSIQWDIFDRAIKKGWKGQKPSVLGTYYSNVALYQAVDYLIQFNQQLEPIK